MRRYELMNGSWNKMGGLMPLKRKPQGGCPAKNNRIMMNWNYYFSAILLYNNRLSERNL
jgi:hypothetical protein